ncbi:sugar 3,4-ketoisomerase [Brucella endophytica]|nr:FdtA/QdtA family cupin domain-containing protein [Brucella endophytica]
MEEPYILKLPSRTDSRGQLVALESKNGLPFDLKRVYYMIGMSPDQPRGYHAHRKLQQLAICLAGSCTFIFDDGQNKHQFRLSKPDEGVYIGRYMWHEMHDISADCILLVLASEEYSEADYIRDYSEFLKEVGSREI